MAKAGRSKMMRRPPMVGAGVPSAQSFPDGADQCRSMGTAVVDGQPFRHVQADALKQVGEIAAPAEGHVDVADAVLHQQGPADDPGEDLPEADVGIGVGAAAGRHPSSELRVAQGREAAGDGADHEEEHHARAPAGTGLPHAAEAARPDHSGDAEEGEVPHGQRAVQEVGCRSPPAGPGKRGADGDGKASGAWSGWAK